MLETGQGLYQMEVVTSQLESTTSDSGEEACLSTHRNIHRSYVP